MFHRGFSGSFRCCLRGKRSRFSGASEAQTAGTCPAERITLYIGNGHDGIVESGLDMSQAPRSIFFFSRRLRVAFLVTAFAISVIPP